MPTETGNQTDRQLLTDFASGKDEEAFAELVRRHGPMVLGVCRQMLRNQHDAEDTFQATFLVLARKAGSIRSPEALPNWLYGVATRLAARNRVLASRRHAREVPLVDAPSREPRGADRKDELWPLLSEEIGRLPDRYRIPFILCYLDGKTNEEAARVLKCAAGTVFSRLARARKRLRERLGRRGVVASGGLLAAALTSMPRRLHADVPPPLLHKSVRAAVRFKAGRAAGTAGIPVRVVKLAQWQLAAAGAFGLKTLVAASLAGVLLVATGGLVVRGLIAEQPVEQRVKGVWQLRSLVMNGQPVPDAAQDQPRITLGEDGVLVTGVATGTYTLDTKARPMQMTWTIIGRSVPGIFEVEGDRLTVCITLAPGDEPTRPLPTNFEPGPGKSVMVYSREQP
jgi:RNA polymerase sigma factor (sigma-70 family)